MTQNSSQTHSFRQTSTDPSCSNPLVEQMQVYYDQRAPVYDQSMGYLSQSAKDKFPPVVDLLGEKMQQKEVLEIACGPGYWTLEVAKKAKSVLATDFNQSTLEQAAQKQFNGNNVSFQVVDAYALDDITERFTAAFAVDWLAHVPIPKISAFLSGLHQRLDQGAEVCFCDQLPKAGSITGVYDDQGNHIQTRKLADGSSF